MSKNIKIVVGGTEHTYLGVPKIHTNAADGDGDVSWVPEEEAADYINLQEKTLEINANGHQLIIPDSGYDGISQVDLTVNIESGSTLQEKTATPTTETQEIVPDEGYEGLSKVTVDGSVNLKPENIALGISMFGVTGTLSYASPGTQPSDYNTILQEAAEQVGGTYSQYFILESDGYTTVGFVLDNFDITAYNSSTGEFSAIGWKRAAYNKNTDTWVVSDFTNTASTGGNFIKNCRYSTGIIYYNGTQIYPFGAGGSSGGNSISDFSIVTSGIFSFKIPELAVSSPVVFVSPYSRSGVYSA